MSRLYSPQHSQNGRATKERAATPTSSSSSTSKTAVLNEFDRLLERRVPGTGDHLDSGDQISEGSEQMAAVEKDLQADAPWKTIQRKTFTRWVNEHLRASKESVTDLSVDLSDGLKLILLVEVLSGHRFQRYNKSPSFRSQKLENVSLALAFLEDEGIKIVSIDSTDIVDGRLKLVLALIWALILHYSISRLKLSDEDGEEDNSAREKMTPKERLLTWFSSKLPLPVKNFTTDWNDGRACGALDNVVAPGLCPDWESWDPKDALRNATEAMNLAEKWLGVPQLIRPEDMIDPNMDEQSMMTYLAQFPAAHAKAGAPSNAKSIGDARQVRCTGRGLQQTGIRIGDEVFFQICTKTAGEGALTVTVTGPDQLSVPFENTGKISTAVHEFGYAPDKPGRHVVEILFGGRHVPKSPFVVNVGLPWVSNIEATGPGLLGGTVGFSSDFYVDAKGEAGMLGFSIEGPSQVTIECKDRGDLKASVKYWPTAAGEYAVHILCGEEDIPGSPFMADIVDRVDAVDSASSVRVTRQDTASPMKSESVDSSETTEITEDGATIVTRRETRVTSQVVTSSSSSSHQLIQTFSEEIGEAGLSGFDMLSLGASAGQDVRSLGGTRCDVSKVVASGSGLEKAACNKTNTFVVKADSAAGYNMLMVGIYGKILHAHEIQVKHIGHANYQVNYILKERGEYLLSVKYGDIHIPGSPFVINCA